MNKDGLIRLDETVVNDFYTRLPASREDLICYCMPYVRNLAKARTRGSTQQVLFDDIVSAGYLALVTVVNRVCDGFVVEGAETDGFVRLIATSVLNGMVDVIRRQSHYDSHCVSFVEFYPRLADPETRLQDPLRPETLDSVLAVTDDYSGEMDLIDELLHVFQTKRARVLLQARLEGKTPEEATEIAGISSIQTYHTFWNQITDCWKRRQERLKND